MQQPWNNTVPLGQEGTGNAVIYGRNPAAAQYGQQLSQLREREQRDELLQQREAQRLAKSFRDNMLSASSGRLWADSIGKIEQEHINQGIQLQQQGINPYESMDPKALEYQSRQREIESMQGYRQAQEAQYNKILDNVRKTGVNNVRSEDIKALNDIINNTDIEKAYQGNLTLPDVRTRFRPDEALKGLQASTRQTVATEGGIKTDVKELDRPATERSIIGRLLSSPDGEEYLNQLTGGIPVNQLRSLPDTLEANRAEIIQEYEGDPQFREQLAADTGITNMQDPQFAQIVNTMAQERLSAKNNFDSTMDNLVASASQGLDLYEKQTTDTAGQITPFQRENLNLRWASLAESKARRLQSASGKDQDIEESLNIVEEYDIPLGRRNPDGSAQTIKGMNFAPFSIPARTMSVNEAIDLRTGEPTQIRRASDSYTTAGFVDVPVTKKKDNSQYKGLLPPAYTVDQPEDVKWERKVLVKDADDKSYLIDIENFPETSLSKSQKAQLKYYKSLPLPKEKSEPTAGAKVSSSYLDLFK